MDFSLHLLNTMDNSEAWHSLLTMNKRQQLRNRVIGAALQSRHGTNIVEIFKGIEDGYKRMPSISHCTKQAFVFCDFISRPSTHS